MRAWGTPEEGGGGQGENDPDAIQTERGCQGIVSCDTFAVPMSSVLHRQVPESDYGITAKKVLYPNTRSVRR